MDSFEVRTFDTSQGFTYRYYISPPVPGAADRTAPTLLLCHGFPDEGHMMWRFVVPYLMKSQLRIVVPDLLGYGGTSKPEDAAAYEIKGMTNDVVELLKKEGIESNIIPIGHDWGAYFVQRFYLLNKDKCAALVTLSVALMLPFRDSFDLDGVNNMTEQMVGYPLYEYWNLFLPQDGPKLIESRLEAFWHVMHGDVEDWMRKMWCTKGAMRQFLEQDKRVPLKSYAQDEKLMNEWIQARQDGGLLAPTNWYRALAHNHNLETEKSLDGTVEKPYLFIACERDAVCRPDAIELPKGQGLLKDFEVKELESAHWCPYEKPEDIGELINDWLTRKGFTGQYLTDMP